MFEVNQEVQVIAHYNPDFMKPFQSPEVVTVIGSGELYELNKDILSNRFVLIRYDNGYEVWHSNLFIQPIDEL